MKRLKDVEVKIALKSEESHMGRWKTGSGRGAKGTVGGQRKGQVGPESLRDIENLQYEDNTFGTLSSDGGAVRWKLYVFVEAVRRSEERVWG